MPRRLVGHDAALAPGRRHLFSPAELQALRVLALVLASVTMSATMLVTLWFVRMRRSFRHDLIMLLIQSDMIKAVWFVILPAIELSHGPIDSRSPVCQTAGFFLAIGIEASDMAAVLVALHTALYIFRGRSGLYPYRRLAFAAFVLVPLLLAMVAFVNRPAFVNVGLYCTMPARPRWARRALSWIPRYLVFTTICAVYVSTYLYVRILMRRFGAAATRGETAAHVALRPARDSDALARRPTASAPPTPPIHYHGLIPPTPPCEAFPAERIDLRALSLSLSLSLPSTSAAARPDAPAEPDQPLRWSTARFGLDAAAPPNQLRTASSTPSLATARDDDQPMPRPRGPSSSSGPAAPLPPVPVPPPPSKSTSPLTRSAAPTPRPVWDRSFAAPTTAAAAPAPAPSSSSTPAPSPSSFNLLSTLRRGPRSSDESSLAVFPSPAALGATDMDKTRDKIGRQLRQLFIYPAVYMVVWLSPFIAHVVEADDESSPSFGDRRSFVLAIASIASLSLQGIADALLFSVLEKPWRHPRAADDPPSTLARWLAPCVPWWLADPPADGGRARRVTTANVGRSREEMLVDSRVARRRRDQELAERRLLQLAARPAASPARDWWDVRLESVDESAEDDDDSVASCVCERAGERAGE